MGGYAWDQPLKLRRPSENSSLSAFSLVAEQTNESYDQIRASFDTRAFLCLVRSWIPLSSSALILTEAPMYLQVTFTNLQANKLNGIHGGLSYCKASGAKDFALVLQI